MSPSQHKNKKKKASKNRSSATTPPQELNPQKILVEQPEKKPTEDEQTFPEQEKQNPTISLEQTEEVLLKHQSMHDTLDEELHQAIEFESLHQQLENQDFTEPDDHSDKARQITTYHSEENATPPAEEDARPLVQEHQHSRFEMPTHFEADTANWTLYDYGNYLKFIREEQGLEASDVTRATNIHQNFILAIEEGCFSELPNKTIAQGFYSSYAKYLGIYSDELKINFNKCIRHYEMTSLEPEKIIPDSIEETPAHKPNSSKASRKTWLLLTIIVLLGILMLSNAFLLQFFDLAEEKTNLPIELSSGPVEQPLEQQDSSETIVQNVLDEGLASQEVEGEVEEIDANPSGPFLSQEEIGELDEASEAQQSVEFPETVYSIGFLVSEGESWYRVTDAENRILGEGLLKQGEKLFKDFGTQTFWILGNADKIVFTLEDKPTDLTSFTNRTTKVANFTIRGRNSVAKANRRIQTQQN